MRFLRASIAISVIGLAAAGFTTRSLPIRVTGQQVDVRAMRVAVVFDPTVLATDGRDQVAKTIDSLAAALGSGPANMTVDVWILGDKMMQHPAPSFEKQVQVNAHVIQQDSGEMASWLKATVKPALLQAWMESHDLKRSATPATCLLTGLFCVASKFNLLTDWEGTITIVISDLLEVCRDWVPAVNMEAAVDGNGLSIFKDGLATDLAAKLIRMSHLWRLAVVHLPSPHVTTPMQIGEVEAIWQRTFSKLGFDRELRFYFEAPSAQDLFGKR
jgi:hypothetical protein